MFMHAGLHGGSGSGLALLVLAVLVIFVLCRRSKDTGKSSRPDNDG